MKKYLFASLTLLIALSCNKEGADMGLKDAYVGSHRNYSFYGESYTRGILNDLVVDHLLEMENALFISDRGARAASFDTGGKKLDAEGAVWKMKRSTSAMNGLTITRTAEDTWLLERSGDYQLLEATYPTTYRLTLHRLSDEDWGHYDWEATLEGSRTEKGGYSCEFYTDGPLVFRQGEDVSSWKSCTGFLMISVIKDGDPVDEACLCLYGDDDKSVYRRLI